MEYDMGRATAVPTSSRPVPCSYPLCPLLDIETSSLDVVHRCLLSYSESVCVKNIFFEERSLAFFNVFHFTVILL